MEEENKIVAAEEKVGGEENNNRGREPHGSVSAPRAGDRKGGDKKGRPSERRGGRGGFRDEKDNMSEKVVAINRISKTVQGGKHVRFSALVVVGDGKGHYGYALAKSSEVPDAIKKALEKARKNLNTVQIVKGDTIAHDISASFGSTKVVLKPATPGTGIIAGGAVRAILELCGIKNVVSKVYGSRTAVNVIHATAACLNSLRSYEKVMVLRGLKTVEQIRAMKAAPVKGDK